MFATYFGLGFDHLLDPRAYDHMLFLAALCAGCGHERWRELLVLVTAFTAGHSVSLAAATLQLVRVPGDWVEFLVMATVVAAAALNFAPDPRHPAPGSEAAGGGPRPGRGRARSVALRLLRRAVHARGARYASAVVFGAIHGLGFSNFLRTALGAERSLLVPLLSFNLGLEAAQVAAVAAISLLSFLAARGLGVPPRAWTAGLSVAAALVATTAAVRRWPL